VDRRVAEAGLALLIAGFGLAVVLSALRHDVGWNPTGPGAGYVPLRVGSLLIAGGVVIALRNALGPLQGRFVTFGAGRRILGMFIPTAAFGLLMPWLGTYVPMALYLFWMTWREGRLRWPVALAVALLVPPAFYLLFEAWLMVPLAKGPLEEALGIW